MAQPQRFSCLLIRHRNWRRCWFRVHGLNAFAFLPPFAPPELSGFHATMAALTAAQRPCGPPDLGSSPIFTASSFPSMPSPITGVRADIGLCHGMRPCLPRAIARPDFAAAPADARVGSAAGSSRCSRRIVFTVVMAWLVLFCCSPPRLAAAQLLRVLGQSMVVAGTGLPPVRRALARWRTAVSFHSAG